MPINFPIAIWIQLANISQFLSRNSNVQGAAMQWGVVKGEDRVPFLLGFLADICDWANTNTPADPALPGVATYMYALCGRWLLQATGILAGVTGILINPITGANVGRGNIAAWQVGFAPTVDGATTINIPYANVMVGSILVLLDNSVIFPNLTDRISYTIAYGSGSTVITLNQPAITGQAYLVQGLQNLS